MTDERNGGQIQLDFWRTMEMADHPEPLTDMPLAFLDGATIELADIVPTALVGHGATGDPSCELAVRESPKHRWCCKSPLSFCLVRSPVRFLIFSRCLQTIQI